MVKDANAGLSIEPENPLALAQAIIEMSEMSKDKLLEMGKNSYNFV